MNEEYRTVTIRGVEVKCYRDGSISRKYHPKGNDRRTFGSGGTEASRWYFHISIKGRLHKVHRLIAKAYLTDYDDNLDVDHIFGNRRDNRPEMLRMVDRSQNLRAFCRPRKGKLSKYRGVTKLPKGMWKARAQKDGRQINICHCTSELEAARQFDAFAIKNGWKLESLNFPGEHTRTQPQ